MKTLLTWVVRVVLRTLVPTLQPFASESWLRPVALTADYRLLTAFAPVRITVPRQRNSCILCFNSARQNLWDN